MKNNEVTPIARPAAAPTSPPTAVPAGPNEVPIPAPIPAPAIVDINKTFVGLGKSDTAAIAVISTAVADMMIVILPGIMPSNFISDSRHYH